MYTIKHEKKEGGFSRVVKDAAGVPIDYHYEVDTFIYLDDEIKVGQIITQVDGYLVTFFNKPDEEIFYFNDEIFNAMRSEPNFSTMMETTLVKLLEKNK